MPARLPWHKWWHRDWLLSEARLSMNIAERGLYRDLLDMNYDDGSIPADLELLRLKVGATPDEFNSAWEKVSRHFAPHDTKPGRLVNKRAEQVLMENEIYRNTQAEIARIAAEERAKQKKLGMLVTKGSLSEPSGQPQGSLRVASGNPQPTEADTESESEQNRTEISVSYETSPPKSPKTAPVWGERFDEWWAIWPKKDGKAVARATYEQVVFRGSVRPAYEELLAGLKHFAERHERLMATTPVWVEHLAERDRNFIPDPRTFLGQLRWVDPPAAVKPPVSRKTAAIDQLFAKYEQEAENAH